MRCDIMYLLIVTFKCSSMWDFIVVVVISNIYCIVTAQHCVLGMLHPRVSSIGCLPLNSVYNCYCSENMVYGPHLVISLATIAIHEACHTS